MQSTFAIALPETLRYEGGYVNHPKDPGGATNRGVTQGTYDRWRRARGLPVRSVREISEREIAEIYKGDYWDVVAGDKLPAGPDFGAFDGAVNSGPSRGAKWLQKAIGAAADGRVGPMTIAAAWAVADKAATVKAMCKHRLSFLVGLRHWSTFGKGWRNRVAHVEAFGVKLAMAAAGAKPVEIERAAAKEEKAAKSKANAQDTGAAASAGGASVPASQVDPQQLPDPATSQDLVLNLVMGGVFLAALVIVAVLIWRGRVNRARAKAYAAVARGE